MEYAFELITLLAAGLFAGGAAYVSLVEHPPRVKVGTAVALAQFPRSYERAAPLEGGAAVTALIFGVAAAFASGDWEWALAGGCVGMAVPVTLLVIAPVNAQLMGEREAMMSDAEAAVLLGRWARLHALRTALGIGGFVIAGVSGLSA